MRIFSDNKVKGSKEERENNEKGERISFNFRKELTLSDGLLLNSYSLILLLIFGKIVDRRILSSRISLWRHETFPSEVKEKGQYL